MEAREAMRIPLVESQLNIIKTSTSFLLETTVSHIAVQYPRDVNTIIEYLFTISQLVSTTRIYF